MQIDNLRKALRPKKQFAESHRTQQFAENRTQNPENFRLRRQKMHLESVICELQIPKFSSPAASYFCKAPQAKIYRFIPLYNGDFNRKISAAGEFFQVYTALQRRFLQQNGRRRRNFLGLYCSTTEISIEKQAPQAKIFTFQATKFGAAGDFFCNLRKIFTQKCNLRKLPRSEKQFAESRNSI